ncbi:MAG: hypothetical protein LN546_06480 [Rickettsia endosymbiont of Ecitomorpha arachnoides]|nr:hypothetical protein [Rickettsia endosymbiont of Sceptobius lativentris]MCC8462774.1 hypothetical protein [Rickettsia endosymbiont of Ecitomorpha arachnoides]
MLELSGSLADYNKNTTLSFQEIREQAWQKNIKKFSKRKKLFCVDTISSLRGAKRRGNPEK